MTKKNIIDSIRGLASKLQVTDETRIDEDWLSYKIDSVAAQLKIKQYIETGILDPNWLSDLGLVTFHKVNKADDVSVSFCKCEIAKAFLPPTIPLISKDGSLDLGIFSMISACGTTQYYFKRMSMWAYTPNEHSNSQFGWYSRINSAYYISQPKEQLRILAHLLHPEDGKLSESQPILSGAIVSGIVYVVKYGQIVYNGVVYTPNSTFTGVGVATYSGSGIVYLYSQVRAYRDIDVYPAGGDMVRDIEIEILTKEFQIEKQQVVDARNDGKDDANKSK